MVGRRQLFATVEQFLKRPVMTMLGPRFSTLAENPHAVNVFKETNSAAGAAQIGVVIAARCFRGAGRRQHSPHQRPRAGTDERPIVADSVDAGDGRGSVVGCWG